MTIAALHRLLDEELPDVPRHPAPPIPQITARKRKFMQQPPVLGPRSPQQAPPAGPAPLAVGQLLAWAEKHRTKVVARKGEQARALLLELRMLHAADEERAQADAEEKRLLQQLAALRARKEELRPKRKSSPSAYNQAAVRAWARANGHTVPARGSIPAPVVEAWRTALAGGGK